MSSESTVEGKRVLVTGASRGLGRHFARLLASRGATVVAGARSIAALQELAADVGERVYPVELDVTRPDQVAAAISEAERLGGLDIVINNSGVASPAPALEESEESWAGTIETNLTGAWRVATAAARSMRARGAGGAIVNIASIVGLQPAGQLAAYAASKAGLIQLTRVLALELARYNIRVNALAPGYVETDMNRDFWATDAGRAMISRIPQGRIGQPEELDSPLLLLAGSGSSYLTGAVLAVDGGHLCSAL